MHDDGVEGGEGREAEECVDNVRCQIQKQKKRPWRQKLRQN